MHPRVERLLTVAFPERTLDADERAVLALEDTQHNLARLRAWTLPGLALVASVIYFLSRVAVSTPAQEAWRRGAIALQWGSVAQVVVTFVGAVALQRAPTRRLARGLGPSFFVIAFVLYALLGINAQRGPGTVTSYVAMILAAPFFLRGSTGFFLPLLAVTSSALVAGIQVIQPNPSLRASNSTTVAAFSLLALAMVSVQRGAVIHDLRLRRELERFNRELESRVAEKTREIRAFAQRLDDVLETERRRLARELHDDLGQELTALRLELEALRARAGADHGGGLARMTSSVDRAHLGVRGILESLRPRILDEEGVDASVRWLGDMFERRAAVRCSVEVSCRAEPAPQVGLVVFRVVQEALTNVARHAGARAVNIAVRREGDQITVTVDDDGAHHGEEIEPGRGLTGMRERVISVGGELSIAPRTPTGTRVEARIPWEGSP